ncbi:MAG: SIR2 family protein [Ktedonobacterales bacterium]
MKRAVLFLGAGFCVPAGLPAGKDLFAEEPIVQSHKAERDIQIALNAFTAWSSEHVNEPAEAFINSVYDAYRSDGFGYAKLWGAIVKFLGYRLASPFAAFYRYEGHSSRALDNINEAYIPEPHQFWWNSLLEQLYEGWELTVVTTNWDILVERALRPHATTRHPKRPGFHYGFGLERLAASSGYPRSEWRRNPVVSGTVPLLKLHGSLNWSIDQAGSLIKWGDLRPAFRGDAAIVPPTKYKTPPPWANTLWQQAQVALESADCVLVVGYSFPSYDTHVWDLFINASRACSTPIHIFSPSADALCSKFIAAIPEASLISHSGIPDGISDLSKIFRSV